MANRQSVEFGDGNVMLLDTHLHLVHLGRFTYPWLDDVPALKQQSDFTDYSKRAKISGITAYANPEGWHQSDIRPKRTAPSVRPRTRFLCKNHKKTIGGIMRILRNQCTTLNNRIHGGDIETY